ncbi:MAG: hypothetical protein V4693_04800 [Pseudomonadota bacterium]
MESKLNSDEMNALQSLDPDKPAGAATYRDGDLPQRLFAFNLVTRQPSGTTVLTRHGERALFRQACLAALLSLERGGGAAMPGGVKKWLLSSGFIKSVGSDALPPSITPRGRLWLASFEADEAVAETPMTAMDFERRRA